MGGGLGGDQKASQLLFSDGPPLLERLRNIRMLLTIKDVAQELRIKPSTLYAWVAQRKIPCRKIHGLVRFDRDDIDRWVASFLNPAPYPALPVGYMKAGVEVDQLIARTKREVYTRRGETRPRSSLIGKEERDGAREAE